MSQAIIGVDDCLNEIGNIAGDCLKDERPWLEKVVRVLNAEVRTLRSCTLSAVGARCD